MLQPAEIATVGNKMLWNAWLLCTKLPNTINTKNDFRFRRTGFVRAPPFQATQDVDADDNPPLDM